MSETVDIFDPTRSVVLVASAGTGKTWRLVRRYLRIVAGLGPESDGSIAWAKPDEVVAVTFTRAAAVQMRERVFAALTHDERHGPLVDPADDPVLAEVLALRPRAERMALAEQLAAAPIGTLHSYCSRLLAEFPELGGVPPDARPLEPVEQEIEVDSFVASWMDRAIEDSDHPGHPRMLELLARHPVGFVRGELRGMVDDRESPAAGWSGAADLLAARETFVRTQWRECVGLLQLPLELTANECEAELRRGNAKSRLVELREAIVDVRRHLPEPDLAKVAEDLYRLEQIRPHREQGQAREVLHRLRNCIEMAATRRQRNVLPDPQRCLTLEHAEHLACWIELASAIRSDWAESLRARALLRYDDLEQLALELLAHPRARAHLRGRHRHVLVDEYQDISPIQAEILDRLVDACGAQDVKLFYVGDPKQSIYRFRGADPQVFARIEQRHQGSVIGLVENRRSSPPLARFFDQLFPILFAGLQPPAAARPSELERVATFSDAAPVRWDGSIVATRPERPGTKLAVELLLRSGSTEVDLEHPTLATEAGRVALHVRGLLASGANARDVAILVPRWSIAEDHRAALEAEGIAADLAGGRGLLLLPEVRDLINLIRFWVDEHDDMAALGLLRGPCVAVSDLGLYVLARAEQGVDRQIVEPDPTLPEGPDPVASWAAWELDPPAEGRRRRARPMHELIRSARLDPERALGWLEQTGALAPDRSAEIHTRLVADAAALELARDRLRAIQRRAGGGPSADLLADVIAEFRLEAHWLASPRGRRCVANAWRFVEHVRQLEADGPDLQRLTRWLDGGADAAPEGLISPDADAVTIATWHGSKGKEWPIVVVAGLGEDREFGVRSSWTRAPVPVLPALDPISMQVVPVPRIRPPHDGFLAEVDPLHEACANMLAPLEAAEAKRLTYVALTRARDRLILSGEASTRAFVRWDDKAWLGLGYRAEVDHLFGEPKPFYLCKRPLELLITALDLPAPAPGSGELLRPRPGAWSSGHVRVIDDRMLIDAVAGQGTESVPTPVAATPTVTVPALVPDRVEAASPSEPTSPSAPVQLDFGAFLRPRTRVEIEPEPPELARPPTTQLDSDPVLRWRAGPTLHSWRPSAGRSPWPVSELEWDMPLPARQAMLLDDEDPRRLGDLFHAAMQAWDFVGDSPNSASLAPLVGVQHGEREPSDQRRLASWLATALARFADDPLLTELRAARVRNELFHEVDIDALVDAPDRFDRIRGRLDLLWRDTQGLWNVLDYKVTSKVHSLAEMQDLQWEYGPQLLIYRKALERWRPRGEMLFLGRFGLWLATAGKPMWVRSFG